MTATHEYDDIIDMNYPLANADTVKHPRMSSADRAKIFSPFAALKGYEEAIAAKQHIRVPRILLTEESNAELDRRLQMLDAALSLSVHPVVQVVYFEPAPHTDSKEEGDYITFTGMVARYLPDSRILQIVDRQIRLNDICSMEGDFFHEL